MRWPRKKSSVEALRAHSALTVLVPFRAKAWSLLGPKGPAPGRQKRAAKAALPRKAVNRFEQISPLSNYTKTKPLNDGGGFEIVIVVQQIVVRMDNLRQVRR